MVVKLKRSLTILWFHLLQPCCFRSFFSLGNCFYITIYLFIYLCLAACCALHPDWLLTLSINISRFLDRNVLSLSNLHKSNITSRSSFTFRNTEPFIEDLKATFTSPLATRVQAASFNKKIDRNCVCQASVYKTLVFACYFLNVNLG